MTQGRTRSRSRVRTRRTRKQVEGENMATAHVAREVPPPAADLILDERVGPITCWVEDRFPLNAKQWGQHCSDRKVQHCLAF